MSAPISFESSGVSPSTRTTMRWGIDVVDGPERRATTTAPESRAVMYSCPSRRTARGAQQRHRLALHVDPMSARSVVVLENGMSEAATDTSCFGETSMYSTSRAAPG